MLATGGLAGTMSGLLGVGGGVVMVPAMASRRVGASRAVASGTSLAAILPIAAIGTITYGGARQVDMFAAASLVVGSVLGAFLGARLTRRLPDSALRQGFAVLALVVAVRLLIPTGLGGEGHAVPVSLLAAAVLVLVGVATGIVSGLLGIGGGTLIVPVLTLGFGQSQQLAQGTSLAAIIPTGLAGALTHRRIGQVDDHAALLLGSTGAIGAVAGALAATHLPQSPLRVVFAVYLAVTALRTWGGGDGGTASTVARRRHIEADCSGDHG